MGRELRGGREACHKTIIRVAVEPPRHTAGSTRLGIPEWVSLEGDLGLFLHGAIDADEAAVRKDRFAGHLPVEEACLTHDRTVRGSERTRPVEVFPCGHTIFSSLEAWLSGTFCGVSNMHMPRYLDEFIYRVNRRWREGELFRFVLSRALRREPFPYSASRLSYSDRQVTTRITILPSEVPKIDFFLVGLFLLSVIKTFSLYLFVPEVVSRPDYQQAISSLLGGVRDPVLHPPWGYTLPPGYVGFGALAIRLLGSDGLYIAQSALHVLGIL
ncbi:MAG: transposase, partial [Candidatus Thorarchaeota archaeon]